LSSTGHGSVDLTQTQAEASLPSSTSSSSSSSSASYGQRSKQNKVNLNPFTLSNTVPGQFVPIVYAPVTGNGNTASIPISMKHNYHGNLNNHHNHNNNKMSNYKLESNDDPEEYVELLTSSQLHENDQASSGPSGPTGPQYQHQHHYQQQKPRQHHPHEDSIKYFELTVTPSPLRDTIGGIQQAAIPIASEQPASSPDSSAATGPSTR